MEDKVDLNEIVFLCGNGNHPLSAKVLEGLKEFFGQSCKFDHINFNKFYEGELDNRIPNYLKINGKTVVLFQTMSSQELVDEMMDLIWACKKQYGAKKLILISSFVWYRRQDPEMEESLDNLFGKKAKPDEIQRLRMLMDNLSHNGVDELITVTPHSITMSEACKEFGIIFHEIDPSSLFVDTMLDC